MKRANIKTNTYEADGGFMVDIITTEDAFEAWLYHKNYGVKSLMWGSPKENYCSHLGGAYTETLRSFKALVEANLDEYIADYIEEYMDDMIIRECDCSECEHHCHAN